MKQVKLGKLLTPAQCAEARRIMLEAKGDAAATKGLKEYFGTMRTELTAKGVLPEYLAYAVMHAWSKETEAIFRNN